MNRVLGIALVWLLCLPAAWAWQDDKKADKEPPATEKKAGTPKEEFERLTQQFDKDLQKLKTEFQRAQDDNERLKIREKAKDLQKVPAQILELAEKNAKESFAAEAVIWSLQRGGEANAVKAVAVLIEHHAAHPKVAEMSEMLLELPIAGVDKLLRAIAEKNPDKNAQGIATLSLAKNLQAQADNAEKEEAAKLNKEAEAVFAKAIEKYSDVKTTDATVGAEAKMILSLAVGKVAPDIQGEDGDGKQFKLSDYRGKVVLLDFWASWCPPCMKLVPHNLALMKKMEGKPFVLIGVNEDQNKAAMQKAVESAKISWRSFYDGPDGKIAKNWRIQAFPTIILIDEKGVTRHKWVGSPGDKVMDEAVEALVNQAEKAGAKSGAN